MHDRNETYTAINKSIKTLNDPFTRLLEPNRYAALKRGNQGSVIGVGLEVGFGESTDSQLVVGYLDAMKIALLSQTNTVLVTSGKADSLSESMACVLVLPIV